MYLNLLNEEAKEVFLDLCINLAESDDDFCQKEKNLIDQFCQEMNIKHRYMAKLSLDKSLNRLNELCDERGKRAVTAEIIGLVIADEVISDSESKILQQITEKFSISHIEMEKLIGLVNELYELYKRFNLFLNGIK